jgi:very-long-chain (3R)-3-hydroxyacyl-CoA dehydratase
MSSKPVASGRPPKKAKSAPKQQHWAVRSYLIVFNLVSFFGWCLILSSLIKHIVIGPQTASYPITFASRTLAKFRPIRVFFTSTYPNVPAPVSLLLQRASQVMMHLGGLVAFVQSLAVLEVVHAALGWVRSPVPTTAIQVASRLFLVWAVTERYSAASGSAWYASMLFAWSVTESIRYPFYANALMGSESSGLLWCR